MLLLMLLLSWLRVCFMYVKPCGLLDAQIDNGRGDGCYTCVVVWTVVQCSVDVRYCGRLENLGALGQSAGSLAALLIKVAGT